MLPNLEPITPAHSRTVIGPSGVIREFDGKGWITSSPSEWDAIRHPGNEQTTVTLDAILFEDGELVGPDTRDLAGELNARKQATMLVADKLRASNYSMDAFESLTQFTPTSRTEAQLMNELRNIMDRARHSPMSLQSLEASLRALPAPPRSFRRDKQ
jgi:hypothetical protein